MTERCVVIGAGIAGLSFAERFKTLHQESEVLLLEAGDRIGGVIRTERQGGFIRELGPETILDDGSGLSGLLQDLGLEDKIQAPNEAASHRFIALGGKLVPLPKGPGKFLTSPILPFFSKLRLFLEPFKKRGSDPEESFGAFIARRLGKNALENLAEPFASGIYAGIPERMEMASCFPKIFRAEREFGSIMKGARKVGMKGSKVIGFHSGNEELVEALAQRLGENVRLGERLETLSKDGARFELTLSSGERLEADRVVFCCPGRAAAAATKENWPALAEDLGGVPHYSLVGVHLSYDQSIVPDDVYGFGFLIPRKQAKNRALGVLYSSNLFEGRAPSGKATFRVLLGGARNPDILPTEDGALVKEACETLGRYTGISATPEEQRVTAWKDTLPLYEPGHQARLERLSKACNEVGKLHFTGSSYNGSGVALCIRNARALAENIAKDTFARHRGPRSQQLV